MSRTESLSLYGNKLTRFAAASRRLLCFCWAHLLICSCFHCNGRLLGFGVFARSPLLELNVGHNLLTSLPDEVRRIHAHS